MFATKPVNDTFQNALFTSHSTYVSYENLMSDKSLLLTLMFTTIPMELAKKILSDPIKFASVHFMTNI